MLLCRFHANTPLADQEGPGGSTASVPISVMAPRKSKKPRKARKPRHSRSAADRQWSLAVRERDGNRCIVCGSTFRPQAHHIISRQVMPTRWLPGQGVCLCPTHHFFGAQSAHRNPVWFLGWLAEHRPAQFRYVCDLQQVVEEYQRKMEAVRDHDTRKPKRRKEV